jgi:glucosamine 6-phosphate synthetase-like amidotransferase/phosphosugar isomerase protein
VLFALPLRTVSRFREGGPYTRAGPEIGVAATKTFLAQITANYLVGLALAQARGTKYPD